MAQPTEVHSLVVHGPVENRRLDELRQIIEGRYHAGSTFDADAVLIEPTDDFKLRLAQKKALESA